MRYRLDQIHQLILYQKISTEIILIFNLYALNIFLIHSSTFDKTLLNKLDIVTVTLFIIFMAKKSFQNLTFSELAIFSTTLITQIIDTNALISYGNRIKLT